MLYCNSQYVVMYLLYMYCVRRGDGSVAAAAASNIIKLTPKKH